MADLHQPGPRPAAGPHTAGSRAAGPGAAGPGAAGPGAAGPGAAGPHPLVAAWAAAWATDPDGPAGCYTERADVHLSGPGGKRLHGREQIAGHGSRVALAVPDRAAEPLRIIDAGPTVVVEWVFTGRSVDDLVTMAAPGLTWWELDGGRIERELRLVDWSARRIADAGSRPRLAPADGPGRSHGWYRDFADRLLEVLGPYPDLALASAYRDGAVRTTVVAGPAAPAGTDAGDPVAAARPDGDHRNPHDDRRAVGVAGERCLVAIRFDDPGATAAGSTAAEAVAVLQLDDSDRVVAERFYHGSWWPAAMGAPGR